MRSIRTKHKEQCYSLIKETNICFILIKGSNNRTTSGG
uniref:Uncharacterized protein n=1 Tax=Arundo donax TaxID=35708 RepID=A0A0A9CDN3_ARUDO